MVAEVPAQTSENKSDRPRRARVSFGTSRALPDHIVARRTGNVLIKHTILKSDHFPGNITDERCATSLLSRSVHAKL